MKKIIIILILTLITNIAFSQDERHNEVFKNFQDNYNTKKFDKIFNSYDANMKKAMPIETTKQFFSNLISQAGKN
jgi:hypothetical protein